MRFKSSSVNGYQIFAVSGTNTISFAIDFDPQQIGGLLGFAVEREDLKEQERYFMQGFKVFESTQPDPSTVQSVSTFDHPIQSFVWDDFTAKPGRKYIYRFFPVKGAPKNLDRTAAPIILEVETERLYGTKHTVVFNRGVASSQAYARRFGNQKPRKIKDETLRKAALDWLSRDLDDALYKFIDSAVAGDSLLGAFYEFRYAPAVERLKAAVDRGVHVKLVLDAKKNGNVDKKGKKQAAFPREENKAAVTAAGLPITSVTWREKNPDAIAHNKFLVLLKGADKVPTSVWTGSTNLSEGGVHGQTNVGHWVRDAKVAESFATYWSMLQSDPGKAETDKGSKAKAKMAALRSRVEEISPSFAKWQDIPSGTTAVFSPRADDGMLDLYATMFDESVALSCITLVFGISETFKSRLLDNKPSGPISFLMLEKQDKPRKGKEAEFQPLGAKQNVYSAWGSYLEDPLYRWTRETNARALELNVHVSYVHSKFLLKDPLSADPIVVTGSANFSKASTVENDENLLLIRGDKRVADIYFTEFNRLFFHYYFRSVHQAILEGSRSVPTANASADTKASLFLDPTDKWIAKYKPNSLRLKRVKMFAGMAGARSV